MRWENLEIGERTQGSLPGLGESVVRTFDVPEAVGIRFHEVQARSALNRVPERSRMPFRWTINPYRGCTHACAYCLEGGTPILMADGRTKPLADVRVGDRLYGTVREGFYRRYSITQVLAHWETRKLGFRITLEDGCELIASADHRFLTDRGWKYVVGAERGGLLQRPHLTLNNKMMGTGAFAPQPEHSEGYRRGYLCGLIKGDGHVGSYRYDRRGRSSGDVHRFRLAMTDIEALQRASAYLADFDVATDEYLFQPAGAIGASRPVRAIRTQAREQVNRVRETIAWPREPDHAWCAGFLAGIFDAEGHHSGCLRIANTDGQIIDRTCASLRRFGFRFVVEHLDRGNGMRNVRLLGGRHEVLRFFHTVDPAIGRKRSIQGGAIKSQAPLRIVSIEPLDRSLDMFDITTGTGDFIANGVVSHNCFARPTHTYLDFNAREDFEREIVVKVNVPELLRAELARPRWGGEHVALGTNTDPYQWVEGRYRLMRGIWEAMRDFANPCSVLTKSPLITRDIDLLRGISERTEVAANLSVPTLDERAWRETEPHTPHPRKRLEAVAELNRAGIPTGILVAPLIPGVNDAPEQVEEILDLAEQAGATSVGGVGLHLRGEVREIWFEWLRRHRPDLVDRYEGLYERGAYLPTAERERLSKLARRGDGSSGRFRGRDPAPAPTRPPRSEPAPRAQPRLF